MKERKIPIDVEFDEASIVEDNFNDCDFNDDIVSLFAIDLADEVVVIIVVVVVDAVNVVCVAVCGIDIGDIVACSFFAGLPSAIKLFDNSP